MPRKPKSSPSPESRRTDRRVGCALAARWQFGGVTEIGYVQNLSLRGFGLRSRTIHPPGFVALFTLGGDGTAVSVEARVMWSRQIQVESPVGPWHEMGLVLQGEPTTGFHQLVMAAEIAGMVARLTPEPQSKT